MSTFILRNISIIIRTNLDESLGAYLDLLMLSYMAYLTWGIEGDFEAYDEDDAMSQAIKQARKYGAKRQMFNVFLANSDELKDFMNTHDFID